MSNQNDIKIKIKNTIQEISKPDKELVDNKDIYSDLGIRSVDAIKILLALEDCFEISIDDVEFSEARSIDKLADLVGVAHG